MHYKHLIGGEAYGVAHAPGDPVASRIPKRKIEEWLKAGIVEKVADTASDDPESPDSASNTDESSENGEPDEL